MQTETTVRDHLTPVRMAVIKKTRDDSVGEDVEKEPTSRRCTGAATTENSMEVSQETEKRNHHRMQPPRLWVFLRRE